MSVMNRMLRHDLRNDLNVVSGYASLVVDEHGDEADRRAAAGKVVERVEEMLDTANKVRAVERALDSGTHPREERSACRHPPISCVSTHNSVSAI